MNDSFADKGKYKVISSYVLATLLPNFYFAARYGPQIIAFIAMHKYPAAEAVIVVLVATAALIFYFWWGSKS
jgi:hypothetical protein